MDAYHTELTLISRILKRSPGSLTLENLLRLANFYKFETFNEEISPGTKRISIAGKILVIDIDFHELPSSAKEQTRIGVDSVKLILANNDSIFKVGDGDGSQVLESALRHERLGQFDTCLEQLTVLDQNSSMVDLFQHYTRISDELARSFALVFNADEFSFVLNEAFTVSLISDERVQLTTEQGSVEDVALKVALTVPMPLPRRLVTKLGLLLDEETPVAFSTNSDIYLTNDGITIQLFQLVQTEFVLCSGLVCGDVSHLLEALNWLLKYDAVHQLFQDLQQGEPLDRFISNDTQWFNEFIKGVEAQEPQSVKVTLTDEDIEWRRADKATQFRLSDLTPEKIRDLAKIGLDEWK